MNLQNITVNHRLITDTPDLAVCPLSDWGVVSVQGPDSESYLQGQLTLDIAALASSQHQLAGHCDAKGKMWSNLRLVRDSEGFRYLLRHDVREQQITELKKYAIFACTRIQADDTREITGVTGHQARAYLSQFFRTLPDQQQPVSQSEQGMLLWLATPQERFLIIAKPEITAQLLAARPQAITDSAYWIALEIAAGVPIINAINSAQFIPQAMNMQALDAISFKKGCYTGQEMVARAKYRGANKRAMYWLAGLGSQAPAAGSSLELQMGDKWRRTGTVLAATLFDNGQLWVQAVLNNDLTAEDILRPEGDNTATLKIEPLPYLLMAE